MVSRKRKTVRKAGVVRATLTVTHPNAAGIDLGSGSHFVAVPPDRVEESVKEFSSFTVDLHALADWLTSCGVDTVAMESTGVYWIPLFELLESRGFKVYLVNARHVKNVSGRKSDVLDLRTSHSALGAYFRRLCARMDKPKAITAAAHKLARLIYTLLTQGQEYVDQGQDAFEARFQERALRGLQQRAAKLGMKVVALQEAI